jgi:hypothetical protein
MKPHAKAARIDQNGLSDFTEYALRIQFLLSPVFLYSHLKQSK